MESYFLHRYEIENGTKVLLGNISQSLNYYTILTTTDPKWHPVALKYIQKYEYTSPSVGEGYYSYWRLDKGQAISLGGRDYHVLESEFDDDKHMWLVKIEA